MGISALAISSREVSNSFRRIIVHNFVDNWFNGCKDSKKREKSKILFDFFLTKSFILKTFDAHKRPFGFNTRCCTTTKWPLRFRNLFALKRKMLPYFSGISSSAFFSSSQKGSTVATRARS